jgi:hypothetical protein
MTSPNVTSALPQRVLETLLRYRPQSKPLSCLAFRGVNNSMDELNQHIPKLLTTAADSYFKAVREGSS